MMDIQNISISIIAIIVLLLMWKWTRNHPNFDLSDLITGDNGKISSPKFMSVGGWVLMSWGFVTLVQQGKMTEWYLAAYGGLCFGVKVAKDWMDKPVKKNVDAV